MTPFRPLRPLLLLVLLGSLLAACGRAPQPPGGSFPPPTLTVDPELAPATPFLPGFAPDEPRPVAAVSGEDGVPADFVADEVWLATADEAELAAFLARWNGRILRSFDPAAAGAADLPPQYLVRVDAGGADTSRLGADLQLLDPTSTGDHRVSSRQGLELIAAAGREAAAGLEVGMNWVGSGAGAFRDRSSREAPTGSALKPGVPYVADAFAWPSHDRFGAQGIGVAEAWRALDLAGRLDDRVKIAVLDMGFAPDADWPAGFGAISNVPFTDALGSENLLGCGGGSSCPWHGTNVVSAAMALPDNGYGSAGPGGPVADPLVVFTLYDFFTSIQALFDAGIAGADIANMSYGAPVPWYLGWSVLPFEAATAGIRATGVLLFASAGNDGKNVDAEGCTFGVCWERTWYTPCENAGVICVGGLAADSTFKAGGSNYGREQVDIFAPYTLWLGPDPAAPDNRARVLNGTSFSSPFAAGVAALVWAADPGLSADRVEAILLETAHRNNDDRVRRHLDALAAVQAVLGNLPPEITLGAGGEVPLGVELTLSVQVDDFEDPFPCCTVAWASDVDGPLGGERSFQHTFTTPGRRTLTVTATDSLGASSRASLVLDVVNPAPEARIRAPADGVEVFRTARVVLRGSASDRNEPGGRLACERLVWTSSVAGDPFPVTGCDAEVAFASDGPRTLTLTATDPQGASDTARVTIRVVEPPANLPPFVQIASPDDRAALPTDAPIQLRGTAIDPEGASDLTYAWTVQLFDAPPVLVGAAPSVEWTPADTFDFGQEGTYTVRVRLAVRDPQGNEGSDAITLEWVVLR